jgi:hypothetical protein
LEQAQYEEYDLNGHGLSGRGGKGDRCNEIVDHGVHKEVGDRFSGRVDVQDTECGNDLVSDACESSPKSQRCTRVDVKKELFKSVV